METDEHVKCPICSGPAVLDREQENTIYCQIYGKVSPDQEVSNDNES